MEITKKGESTMAKLTRPAGCLLELIGVIIFILGFSLFDKGNIVSGVFLIILTIPILFWGIKGARPRKCPFCKGNIPKDAITCKHCGKELPK